MLRYSRKHCVSLQERKCFPLNKESTPQGVDVLLCSEYMRSKVKYFPRCNRKRCASQECLVFRNRMKVIPSMWIYISYRLIKFEKEVFSRMVHQCKEVSTSQGIYVPFSKNKKRKVLPSSVKRVTFS